MSERHGCPCSETCALQRAMDTLGSKWKVPILCSLMMNGSSRYNDLLRNIRGISNTMLSKSLRELEERGLVRRQEYLEVPVRVEYAATKRAEKLYPMLVALAKWQMDG